jgi:hypothetical protein
VDDSIAVPTAGAPWFPDVNRFALTYNAYEREGGFDPVARRANAMRERWEDGTEPPEDLPAVRSALFFEQRRWRHLDEEPEGRDRAYIDALLEVIGRLSGGAVPGPADDLP